jgi:hypothetical protein
MLSWTMPASRPDRASGGLREHVIIAMYSSADVSASPGVRSHADGFHMYGVVVVMAVKPSRRRIGRLSSVASTWR